jgi:hypothetical protein
MPDVAASPEDAKVTADAPRTDYHWTDERPPGNPGTWLLDIADCLFAIERPLSLVDEGLQLRGHGADGLIQPHLEASREAVALACWRMRHMQAKVKEKASGGANR